VSTGDGPPADASAAELVTRAAEQMSQLVRDEIELARTELATAGKRVGVGAGLLGSAGTLALYGVAALVAAAILALAEPLAPWLAALIVAVVLFAVAGIAALLGSKQVSKVKGVPAERVGSVKSDVAAVKQHRA